MDEINDTCLKMEKEDAMEQDNQDLLSKDVSEHERLFNITFRHKLKSRKKEYYCCSTFNSQGK
jgi:hypothetical protein